MKRYVSEAIFGSSDGLLAALAVTLAAGSRGRTAVLLSLFAIFVAEGFGMGVADFLAKEKASVGWRQAVAMGVSTGGAILAVGVPWLITSGTSAEFGSVIVALVIGAGISQVRPGGWTAWAQTFGLLAAVAAVTGAVGHA